MVTEMDQLFYETTDMGPLINDQTFILILVVGICILTVVLFVAAAVWLPKFQRELHKVNRYIKDSRSERERQHYLKRRRRLWLSLIPFVKYKYK